MAGNSNSGRWPKPAELQQLAAKGDNRTPGGRRPAAPLPGTEVAVKPGTDQDPERLFLTKVDRTNLPDPTPELKLKKTGKKFWYFLWSQQKWYNAVEIMWVGQICQAYDLIEAYQEQIATDGLMIPGGRNKDDMVANPLLGEVDKQKAIIRVCLVQLGHGPAARAKLGQFQVNVAKGMSQLALLQQQAQANRGREQQLEDSNQPMVTPESGNW